MSDQLPRERPVLTLLLGALGAVLFATRVDAVFTVDEDNYLVTVLGLRAGRLTVPGTEGLPPSQELLSFDPADRLRTVEKSPVASTVPPLWAFLALPFSLLGWPGLVFLNVLAFLGTAALVFGHVRRVAQERWTPWLALVAFACAAFNWEYAQGLWPHSVAVLLCTAAFVTASRARSGGGVGWAALSGLLGGLAAGVRYQNVLFAACVGAGLVLLSPGRRLRLGAACLAGAALPLLASAAINAERLGVFNPVTKGPGYQALDAVGASGGGALEVAETFWAKVVDMSVHPAFPPAEAAANAWAAKAPDSGAFLVAPGVVKKALLQSVPWAALALVLLPLALWRRRSPDAAATEQAAVGGVVFPVLALFAVAGFGRHDGLCFNQRYFLELVPLLAIALALGVDADGLRPKAVLAGALPVAGLAALVVGRPFTDLPRQLVTLSLPLALAALLVASHWLRGRPWGPLLLSAVLGMGLGWGGAVHLAEDLRASREVRERHRGGVEAVARRLPQGPVGLFACASSKVALAYLRLERDLVLMDGCVDGGKAAASTAAALLQRRRVFVLLNGYSSPELSALTAPFEAILVQDEGASLLELRLKGGGDPPVTPNSRGGPEG